MSDCGTARGRARATDWDLLLIKLLFNIETQCELTFKSINHSIRLTYLQGRTSSI